MAKSYKTAYVQIQVMWLWGEKQGFANWVYNRMNPDEPLGLILSSPCLRADLKRGCDPHQIIKIKDQEWLPVVKWWRCGLPPQEDGFTGFMRNLRGRDQEKVGKKKEELWGRPPAASFVIALWPLTPG